MRREHIQVLNSVIVLFLAIGFLAGCASGSSGPTAPSTENPSLTRPGSISGISADDVASMTSVGSLGDWVNLVVVLADTPANLCQETRENADRQFAELFDVSEQVRRVYADNRGMELSAGVQAQVGPLADRLSQLREDRAAYAASLLHAALDGMQDAAVASIESIDDTTVLYRDVVINSLGISTTTEHLAEIESLPFVYEVIEGVEAIPILDTSAQSLKLRPGTYPDVVWDQGYHGEGEDVLLVDLGMLTSHVAFTGLNIISQKFPPSASGCVAEGGFTHGTWCAGAIASQDETYRGLAYGIETLYNAKLCDGYDAFQTLQMAYDWAGLGGSGYDDAEVVSLSLVFSTACSQNNGLNVVSAFVDGTVDVYGAMWSLGAGNRGTGCSGNVIFDKPQTCYNGVSVAAIDASNNTGTRDDDVYSTVSKYGPCHDPYYSEDRLKPELLCPTNVTSTEGGGGWGNFPGTSCSAPHYAGVVAVLYSAGVGTSLEMRALTFATAEDYTASPASVGPDFYAGFGYVDTWEAYSHIADTFTGSFTLTGESDFFRIENAQDGDRVVAVYDKHGTYPNWQISNLDIKVFDEATEELLYETTKIYEPREYVQIDSSNAGKNLIVAVTATEIADGVSEEQYAVSANTVLTEVNSPELGVTVHPPTDLHQYDVFEISADVENTGGATAQDVTAEISLPSGWQIVAGDNPQSLGDLDPTEIGTAYWTIFAITAGTENVAVEATGTFYGVSIVGEGDADLVLAETKVATVPSDADLYEIFAVQAEYTNNSPGSYDDLTFTVNYDADDLTLISGENPALMGSLLSGETANAEWTFIALQSGDTGISVDVDFTYGGVPLGFSTDPAIVPVSDVQLLTYPDTVEEKDNFNIQADYTNAGSDDLVDFSFTINFPPENMSLENGENPALVGTIGPTETAHADWEFKALEPGAAEVSLTVEFTYAGTDVGFTTAPVLITIEEEYVDPFAPILLQPADGTEYNLGMNLLFRWEKAPGTSPSAYFLDVWVDGEHSPLVPEGGLNLGLSTTIMVPARFIELNARDGTWEWAVAAQLASQKNWSNRWTISKETAPMLNQPADGAQVNVNEIFDWEDSTGAINYVARVTGILPAGQPYFMPLNSSVSQFLLTFPYYNALQPGVNYTWAVAGTALGTHLDPKDQDTLARLSYSEIRGFTRP